MSESVRYAGRQAKALTALGSRIRAARERLGLAQSQLAEAAEVSVETIGRIERGQISPSFLTVARIAQSLAVTVSDLADPSVAPAPTNRRALERVLRVAERLDDATLGALADFLRGVSARPGRRASARSDR